MGLGTKLLVIKVIIHSDCPPFTVFLSQHLNISLSFCLFLWLCLCLSASHLHYTTTASLLAMESFPLLITAALGYRRFLHRRFPSYDGGVSRVRGRGYARFVSYKFRQKRRIYIFNVTVIFFSNIVLNLFHYNLLILSFTINPPKIM